MNVAWRGVGAHEANGAGPDLGQGEPGEIEHGRAGSGAGRADVEATSAANGAVSGEGDFLKRVDLPIGGTGVGEQTNSAARARAGDVELLLSEVGGVGGGEAANIE